LRLRPLLPTVLAAVLAVPLVAHAAQAPAPAVPTAAGVPGSLAKGTGTDLRPVANISYKGGTDMEFATIKGRDYAVVPSEAAHKGVGFLRMIDITVPAKPVVVGVLSCNVTQNDVQVRGTTVFMGVDGGVRDDACFQQAGARPALGVIAIDISDPARPRGVGFVPIKYGAHNTSLHPSGDYLYVSDSELVPATAEAAGTQTGRINVVDVRNLRKMKEVFTLPLPTGLSNHDISFNKKGSRAYAAAITETLILDTTAPAKPSIVTRIIDPSINISHGADITPDEKHILVTDEQAGAAGNGVCNVGGVHVYDISNELVPVKVGFYAFSPVNSLTATTNSSVLTCTAHVLDYGPTGKTFSNAGYAAGVRIVDSSNLLGVPKELASFTAVDADTWSAKQYKSKRYLFANDLARGFDVFEYVPGLGPVDTRTTAQKRFGVHRVGTTTFMNGAWCAQPSGTAASHAH
jgi:hypothetical protein